MAMKMVGRCEVRVGRVAARIVAMARENMELLSEAAMEAGKVSGVKRAELWDSSWDGATGVIDVELPVKEWAGEDYPGPKVPMAFGVDPRIVARRVGDRLKVMGLRVMGVKFPVAVKGMFGKFKGWDMGSVRLEVGVAA
jgi:hypothetical protein